MVNFKKKLLPSAMAAALVGGGIGLSNTASAIEVAADHTGQALIGAVYIAEGKHADGRTVATGTTHIRVINPSNDHAVKARIAFRSKVDCVEVLDFILFLTPGDVWYASIELGDDGEAYIVSNDDSMYSLPYDDFFASEEGKAVRFKLFDDRMNTSYDYNEMGMFEVVAAYSASGQVIVPDGTVVDIYRTMSKRSLEKVFRAQTQTLLELNGCGGSGLLNRECPINLDPDGIQLRGEVDISLDIGGTMQDFSYIVTALDEGTDVVGDFDNSPLLVRNSRFDVMTSGSLNIGSGFGNSVLDWNGHTYYEIERLLAASSLVNSYNKGDITFVTFPLRYNHSFGDLNEVLFSGLLPPPPYNATGSVNYTIRHFDNQENGVIDPGLIVSGGCIGDDCSTETITSCVEWFMPDFQFDSGWYSLDLVENPGAGYRGIPALAYTMNFSEGKFLQNSSYQSNTNFDTGLCAINGDDINIPRSF